MTEINNVIYIQCPHCKKGWYGRELHVDVDTGVFPAKLNQYIIEGINPTDISKELMCLNCGHHYTPLAGVEFDEKDYEWKVIPSEGVMAVRTWDFVAQLITTCKGK